MTTLPPNNHHWLLRAPDVWPILNEQNHTVIFQPTELFPGAALRCFGGAKGPLHKARVDGSLRGWLLCLSLCGCSAQVQLPRDQSLKEVHDSKLHQSSISLGWNPELSKWEDNWEQDFSLKVFTALQCWKKSLWGSDPFWCFSKPALESSRYIYIGGGLLSTATTLQELGTTNQLPRFDSVLEYSYVGVDGCIAQ